MTGLSSPGPESTYELLRQAARTWPGDGDLAVTVPGADPPEVPSALAGLPRSVRAGS
jgi:hypothetical protein